MDTAKPKIATVAGIDRFTKGERKHVDLTREEALFYILPSGVIYCKEGYAAEYVGEVRISNHIYHEYRIIEPGEYYGGLYRNPSIMRIE